MVNQVSKKKLKWILWQQFLPIKHLIFCEQKINWDMFASACFLELVITIVSALLLDLKETNSLPNKSSVKLLNITIISFKFSKT